jgi:DNA-binding transcriptional ArsR family regulator
MTVAAKNSKKKPSPLLGQSARCARVVEILKSVAHPLRLQLVAALCEDEMNVGELATVLGASQAVVSQQLRILRMNRLVDVKRAGGFAVYRLAEPHLQELVACMARCRAAEG